MGGDLIASFAIIGLFIAVWALSQEWIRTWPAMVRLVGAGTFMGAGAATSMALSVELTPGFYFDLRAVLISLAGIFAGPFAALLSGLIAIAVRLSMGGGGVVAGALSIGLATGMGCLGFVTRRRLGLTLPVIAGLALAQAILPIAAVLPLPADTRTLAIQTVLLPMVLLTGFAAFFAVLGLEKSRYRGWLIHLLRSAVTQAPDYFYIKDKKGRLIIANQAVTRAAGLGKLSDLIGRTDFDLTDPEHAAQLHDAEQRLLSDLDPIVDFEEELTARDGSRRTYFTTKRAILNEDGTVAGLVGVTKDLTDRLSIETKLLDTQAQLDVVLEKMSDGLARFDSAQHLVFCNHNYQQLFSLTGHMRVPGTPLRDILEMVVSSGEQILPLSDADAWIDEVLARTRTGGEEQVQMLDGRWLMVRTAPLPDGGAVVIVSDISTLKQAEEQMSAVAEQFRILASTDPLTGLDNRRSFDRALEDRFALAIAESKALAVILIDIDHFKAYNDTYGHPAGDACIRRVAGCIRHCTKRPTDILVRYGGEEFALILPDTDLDGGRALANRLRAAVADMDIPHRVSHHGVVTISLGVSATAESGAETALEFLGTADRALYRAKAGGRNLVRLVDDASDGDRRVAG